MPSESPVAGLEVALWSPRLAANIGAVGRLCAVCAVPLHVIRPVPFSMSDRSLQRAGMDYLELLDLRLHEDWAAFREEQAGRRVWLLTTKATRSCYEVAFLPGDTLLFGNEPHGVDDNVHADAGEDRSLCLPMRCAGARSLNLATACSAVLYEALRQVEGWGPRGRSITASVD
jgi:tRNA (cytidine/uridine-2'-O-)-methyltransferase